MAAFLLLKNHESFIVADLSKFSYLEMCVLIFCCLVSMFVVIHFLSCRRVSHGSCRRPVQMSANAAIPYTHTIFLRVKRRG